MKLPFSDYFWKLCQKINSKDVVTNCSISIPGLILMVLMRCRHNLPFEFLSILYGYQISRLHDIFWQYALTLYQHSNLLQKFWSATNVTDEELNGLFENLYNRADPLHKHILDRFEDPLQQKRKAYCE